MKFKKKFEETKKLDGIMEIERLKKVRIENEKEIAQRKEEIKGKKIIIKQIEENYIKRLIKKKQQMEEAEDMVKYIKQLELDQIKEGENKMMRQRKLRDQIQKENKLAIEIKTGKILLEKKEEEKIMQYLNEKSRKEEEYQKELIEKRNDKEREVAKLREKQEKAMDLELELDQLRAKRARQKEDRAAREKEKREALKRERINQELIKDRKIQIRSKQTRLIKEAEKEQAEFQKLLQTQKITTNLLQQKDLMRMQNNYKYGKTLKDQIELNETKGKEIPVIKLKERDELRNKLQREKENFLRKKHEKLEIMEKENIRKVYRKDLEVARFFY